MGHSRRNSNLFKLLLIAVVVTWLFLISIYLQILQKDIDAKFSEMKELETLKRSRKLIGAYGELGYPVTLPNHLSEAEKAKVDEGWENHAFNEYVSNLISLRRSLKDVRSEGCKKEDYGNSLPKASVIICFHNEAWSTLLRTIHSIMDRTPNYLLQEIIIVDDFSDFPHLGEPLEKYINTLPLVHLIRCKKREGLIRARLLGTKAAKAPILVFLDSHCECTEGWLQPLVYRIAMNKSHVVSPSIDAISDKTFEYINPTLSPQQIGGFDWTLQFNWYVLPNRLVERGYKSWDPIPTPTIAGGLFAIDKLFFEKLGTYDPEFDIWGAENLELSFKTWMCGGTLEILPCSHVGHIFRARSPYSANVKPEALTRNLMRLAEVWLDDYKKYFYERLGQTKIDYGDVEERKDLRKRLKCKSFNWYLNTIYPEMYIPGEAVAFGEIRNLGLGNDTCLDAEIEEKNSKRTKVIMYPCHEQGGNQYFGLSKSNEIRRDNHCLDYDGKIISLYECHSNMGNQEWKYDKNVLSIFHPISGKCLEMESNKTELRMEECNQNDKQKWYFQHLNETLYEQYWENSGFTSKLFKTSFEL